MFRTLLAGLLAALLTAACTATAPTGDPPAPSATLLPVLIEVATYTPTGPAPTVLPESTTTSAAPTAALGAGPGTGTLQPTPEPSPTPLPAMPTHLPTPDDLAPGRQVRLPILMYHYVEPWPADAGEIRRNLTVRPDDFAAQMQFLAERGYTSVSLYDLIYALSLGQPLPERAVVLTFDDGYRSLVDYAVPVMQAHGFSGTVFVVTELMDKGLEAYLTWPQAEALYAQGWKIEPHTKTHDELKGRERDFQLYQMLGSMQTVEAHIGSLPRFFNYPAGKYDDLTLQLARELHLWGGVTVDFGRVHTLAERYSLGRVRVGGQMSLPEFAAALGEAN